MTHTRTALAIGGGIAGPVAAMALQRAGIEAVVYEARDAPSDYAGLFLNTASNGLDVLSTSTSTCRPGLTASPYLAW